MDQSYVEILTGVRKFSHLLDLAEQGETPEEIKQRIIKLLSPYFQDQNILAERAVDYLVPVAVNFSRFASDPWAKSMFELVLKDHREAQLADEVACFQGSADWEEKIAHGISEYWSAFHLEIPKDNLPNEEFKYELFHNLGVIIEACQQPLLRELLLHVRIRRGKMGPAAGLEALNLGQVIGELYDTSGYSDFFAPPPWGVRLNQWRNMAQHHKTRVEGDQIIGTYGRPSDEKEVWLQRSELWDVVQRSYLIFTVLSTTRSVFLLDNLQEFAKHMKPTAVRTEPKILGFASSVATQGFELTDITIEKGFVEAVVTDVTIASPAERMFHASQFVCLLWSYFPVEEVTIRYNDKQGDRVLTTIGRGSDCNEVSRGVIPHSEMANRVRFLISKKGKSYLVHEGAL